MAEIVNLKRARKEKARRDLDNEAQANRLRFGRTKARKAADKQAEAKRREAVDGKRLEETPDDA